MQHKSCDLFDYRMPIFIVSSAWIKLASHRLLLSFLQASLSNQIKCQTRLCRSAVVSSVCIKIIIEFKSLQIPNAISKEIANLIAFDNKPIGKNVWNRESMYTSTFYHNIFNGLRAMIFKCIIRCIRLMLRAIILADFTLLSRDAIATNAMHNEKKNTHHRFWLRLWHRPEFPNSSMWYFSFNSIER